MAEPVVRILPRVTPDNDFFWTSGADGRLRFLRCDECNYYVHPPSPICPECLSKRMTPTPVSGGISSATMRNQGRSDWYGRRYAPIIA